MRILQLTDLHIFANENETLQGIDTRESLRNVIAAIQRNQEEFDLLVITGDHTHDELAESYEFVREQIEPWIDRVLQVPGNHDDRSIMRQIFGDRIQSHAPEFITFSHRISGWQLLGIDSHIPEQVPGRIDDAQLDWIRAELNAARDIPTVIFMHHPPVAVNSVWMDKIGLQNPASFQQLIQNSPQVKLIVCGHVHHEFRSTLGQAAVLASPSTGLQFDPTGDSPKFAVKDSPGYSVFEFTADEWSVRVERVDQ